MTLNELRQKCVQLHKDKDISQAKLHYAAYLRVKPDDYMMWSNLGALFRSEGDFELSVAAHRRALEGPKEAQILGNASNAFFDGGYAKEAVELRKSLLDDEPDNPTHHAMLAKYLRGAGKYQKAERVCKQAVKKFPEDPELHIQMAMAQLSLGKYAEGFESFNWRWQGDEISLPEFAFPQWKGEDVKGKTVLVIPEQGFGDTVLMARFLSGLKERQAQVLLSTKAPLRRVFQTLPGMDEMIIDSLDGRRPDFWAPMMDLPRYLGTDIKSLPAPALLNIPKDAIERAKAIVAPHQNKLKVGVLWSGSVTYRANHKRSFDHRRFLQFSDIPNLQMFSLYKGPLQQKFIEDGSNTIIVDAAGSDRDFADSAALINELDIVITMDSAIAHVAGSLGADVWNLLHSEAYWLYEPFADKTPWYPSMRLIRQKKSGDWDAVFDRLHKGLSQRAAKKEKE